MTAKSVEIGTMMQGGGATLTATADEGEHLVPVNSPAGLSVVSCPSGSLKVYVPAGNVAYLIVTEETDVHAHEAASRSGVIAKGARVRHETHGTGTVGSEAVDEDGEWYVVFDSGISGYIEADSLALAEGDQ